MHQLLKAKHTCIRNGGDDIEYIILSSLIEKKVAIAIIYEMENESPAP